MRLLKNISKRFIFYLLFAIVGIFMFWQALEQQNFKEILAQLYLADYTWAFLILIVTIINHVVRSLRWRLLYKPLGYNISLANSLAAIIFGYFVSLGIPRLGELSRCMVLNRDENVPVNISLAQ